MTLDSLFFALETFWCPVLDTCRIPEKVCRQCLCGQICRSSGGESIAFGKLLQAGLIEMVQQRSASGKVANVPGADLLLAFESIRAGKEPEFTFTAVVEGSGRHACDPNELT